MRTSSIRLPALSSQRSKYAAGLLCALFAAALYLLPNRMPVLPQATLPLTAIDTAVPFWPASGWLYASLYVLLLWTFVAMRDLGQASRFLYACLFAQIAAATIFVTFPTVYPRELFPLPEGTHPLNAALVEFWRQLDAPANCLPSLHVANTVLCLAVLATGRSWRCLCILGVLMCLSTLTFKQHYFVDIAAGAALGLATYVMFFRWGRIEL